MKIIDEMRAGLTGALAFSLLAALSPLAAQSPGTDDPGVALMNDSRHQLRVYAYEPPADSTQEDEAERVLLGWVGADELEFFQVPATAIGSNGEYRIAVQQVTPLPQIGVPAAAHPVLATPTLDPEKDETVRITVGEQMDLSHVVVK